MIILVCLTHRRSYCYQCAYNARERNCKTIPLDEYNALVLREKQRMQNKIALAMTEAYNQIQQKEQRILDCIEADPRKSYVEEMSINVDIRVFGTKKFWKINKFLNESAQKLKRNFNNSVGP